VGVLESIEHATPAAFQRAGTDIVLLGEPTSELGGSEYLHTIHGVVAGAPPSCDLNAERALIDALLESIAQDDVTSAHDCSDGGLAVALAECSIGSRAHALGADVDLGAWTSLPLRALLFGEAQGRVLVSTSNSTAVIDAARRHGVPARKIGTVNDGASLRIRVGARVIEAALAELADAWHEAIPRRMSRSASAVEVAFTAATPA
jgi:phosphoribosylformylglycinamidine synthase subunit PurL